MGFESGNISLRMFYVPGGFPGNYLERFAQHAPPPIETLGRETISGWVSGRHLLDRAITEDNAMVAGYLRLTLMKAERKIPPALLRAECKMEELAELQASGLAYLKRDAKAAIKKAITERLLPKMPPTLTGIDMAYDAHTDILYAAATSEKQVDALTIAIRQTTGVSPVPLTPASAAAHRRGVLARDLAPTSFSPECEDAFVSDSLGQDFLTWMWFMSEMRGGSVTLDNGTFAGMIEGPLTFVLEGQGAHETVLRKGSPVLSSEAKSALLAGKKLRRARLVLARGEEIWSTNLDAEEFVLRGLKLPAVESADPVGRFHDRMMLLDTFREALLGWLECFLEERINPDVWSETRADIHRWVAERPSRR